MQPTPGIKSDLLRANFAPHCDRRVPHLRRANCGLRFLVRLAFASLSAFFSTTTKYTKRPVAAADSPSCLAQNWPHKNTLFKNALLSAFLAPRPNTQNGLWPLRTPLSRTPCIRLTLCVFFCQTSNDRQTPPARCATSPNFGEEWSNGIDKTGWPTAIQKLTTNQSPTTTPPLS